MSLSSYFIVLLSDNVKCISSSSATNYKNQPTYCLIEILKCHNISINVQFQRKYEFFEPKTKHSIFINWFQLIVVINVFPPYFLIQFQCFNRLYIITRSVKTKYHNLSSLHGFVLYLLPQALLLAYIFLLNHKKIFFEASFWKLKFHEM